MENNEPRIIALPKFLDKRGNLSVIEEWKDIPFKIERTYWIYDVPGGEARGGHAGSFDVILDDGKERKTYSLNRSYYGLYVPKGIWREMNNFSTNSLALILSSTAYNTEDYIYDYEQFLSLQK